jgi:hypothetical protein
MIKFTDKAFESFEGYTGHYITRNYNTIYKKYILSLHAYSHVVSKKKKSSPITDLNRSRRGGVEV